MVQLIHGVTTMDGAWTIPVRLKIDKVARKIVCGGPEWPRARDDFVPGILMRDRGRLRLIDLHWNLRLLLLWLLFGGSLSIVMVLVMSLLTWVKSLMKS